MENHIKQIKIYFKDFFIDKLINNCLGRIELCATLTSITKLEYNQVNGTVLVFTTCFDLFFHLILTKKL